MSVKRIKTKQDAIDAVNEQYRNHKGKWLTMETVEKYQARVRMLDISSNEMIGTKYEIMLEIMAEYGVTQLEATNILNGFHVADYVNKYYRIQNKIPLDIKEKNTSKSEDDNE